MKTFYLLLVACPLISAEVEVHDAAELKTALAGLRDGTRLKLASGSYPGGHHVSGIRQLTVEAADPSHPPVFQGGGNAWQFSGCHGLTLRHLKFTGQSGNGLNLDDGGKLDERTSGITLENLDISDIGPKGNHDAIKCSGLQKLTIRDCTISGWGGQGIDFVGCHDSLITGCKLEGKEGFSATAGIQLKGGSSGVTVEKCVFRNAGERPLNVGGSTGLAYFRPQNATAEASKIVVRDCTIEGSVCAVAFVGVDGAEFSGNTVLYPKKWLIRILQETRGPRFAPCRNVVVKGNRFTFRRSEVSVDVNIGEGTAPETFVFEGNHWTAEDRPEASQPKLPTPER